VAALKPGAYGCLVNQDESFVVRTAPRVAKASLCNVTSAIPSSLNDKDNYSVKFRQDPEYRIKMSRALQGN